MGNATELKPIKGVKDKDIIAVVRGVFPGYDKTLHSKVKRGYHYGIMHKPEATEAIDAAFGLSPSEALETRRADTHRYTRRFTARVADEVSDELQLYAERDGYKTKQELVEVLLFAYLKRKRRAAEKQKKTA